jgi:hypothetical protein
VTFGQKSSKLNSRPVYCLLLYGNYKLLKMASREMSRRSYECSPLLSLFVCVKNKIRRAENFSSCTKNGVYSLQLPAEKKTPFPFCEVFNKRITFSLSMWQNQCFGQFYPSRIEVFVNCQFRTKVTLLKSLKS